PPAIAETLPGNGWVQTSFSDQLTIYFASQMNLDSLKDKVVITPTLDRQDWYYNEWERAIYFYGLHPSTRYQVKILPGMADLYGNQITKGLSFSFTTAPYSPSAFLEMPYSPAIYRSARVSGTGTAPASPPMEFYVRYVNTNVLEFELYQLTAEQFASMNNGDIYQGDFIPNEQDLIRKWRFSARGKLNDYSLTPIPLETGKAEPLPNGFYFLGLNSADIPHDSRFLDTRLFMVANTNLTFKMSDTDALVWMTDLESGAPIANAPVALYDRNFQSIEEGSTDNNGLVYFKGLKVEKKVEKAETYSQRFVMVGAVEPRGLSPLLFGVASSEWGSGVSPYDFGIWSDYYTPSAQVVAYVYTDRPLYRPGQPVSFKGIVRMSDDLAYSLPAGKEISVKINSYDETIYEETLQLSSFGSFFGQLSLDKDAALGSYTISVQFPGDEQILGSVDFNVAEYRKPEFQVEVSTEKPAVLAGETFSVTVNAEYYSGGGVKGAQVNWALSTTTYTFSPPDELGNYNFSDINIGTAYNEFYSPQSEIIAEGQDVTDENGQLILPLPANLNKAKTSQEFTVEATVTDLSGNAVSGRSSIIAHASKVYAGIKAREYVGIANQEQYFDLVAVDWDGKPIPGQSLDVEIAEERWSSVQEQDPSGNIQWKSTVEEIPVSRSTGIVTDAEGKASVSFTPPNGGTFKATVTTRDD
ncbi:MAG: MG2 domain-containing protein, partial [Anaerolineales bacterium]|nr:MG2 domain-containing protein [Anaerolineales bacterium]